MDRSSLTRFTWLSIGAALATIGLKSAAFLLTGSVGLLSDALESVVNLVGAVVALVMLTIAARPPDAEHAYGHDKAEYFSSGVEGALVLIAAASIAYAAVQRLFNPQPLEQVGLGLGVSVLASLINLGVSRVLLRAGRQYHSITLEADAQHLLTDVWTSVGVLAGVAAVAISGWQWLDPVVAILVALNILRTGSQLVRRSIAGLMDVGLPANEQETIRKILAGRAEEGVQYHRLRTRQAASRRFVSVDVLVPPDWTVQRGHQFLSSLEGDIRGALPDTDVVTHLEPVGDPVEKML